MSVKVLERAPAGLDPKLGVTTIATIFGLTYSGHRDPEDNGIGAFGARTANRTLIGVSIPIPIYRKTPHMSAKDIKTGKVTVTILYNDEYYTGIPIVDLGPGEEDFLLRSDDGTHLLDRTYGLCALMDSFDNAKLTFWVINPEGVPYKLEGLDTPYLWI